MKLVLTVATLGLLLLKVSTVADAAAAPAALCDCWKGLRVTTAPCTCSCPSATTTSKQLVTPYCAFATAASSVNIIIATNETNSSFASPSTLENRLGVKYRDSGATILYRRIIDEPTDFSTFYKGNLCYLFAMNGTTAKSFLESVIAGEAWVLNLGIIDANMFSPHVALAQAIQGPHIITIPDAGGYVVPIHVWDIIWVLFLIFPVCFIACCECCCCTTNTTAKAERFRDYEYDEYDNEPFHEAVIAVEAPSGNQGQTPASPAKAEGKQATQQPVETKKPSPSTSNRNSLAVAGAGGAAGGGEAHGQRRSTMRKSVGDVDKPRPPRGRAKRPGKGRGLEPDMETTDLKFDQESGLWWSAKEFLFFNKKTQMWYDPESTFWFDPAENRWFEYNE